MITKKIVIFFALAILISTSFASATLWKGGIVPHHAYSIRKVIHEEAIVYVKDMDAKMAFGKFNGYMNIDSCHMAQGHLYLTIWDKTTQSDRRFSVNWDTKENCEITDTPHDETWVEIHAKARVINHGQVEHDVPITILYDRIENTITVTGPDFKFIVEDVIDDWTRQNYPSLSYKEIFGSHVNFPYEDQEEESHDENGEDNSNQNDQEDIDDEDDNSDDSEDKTEEEIDEDPVDVEPDVIVGDEVHDVGFVDFFNSINGIRLENLDGSNIPEGEALQCDIDYKIWIKIQNFGDFPEDITFDGEIGDVLFNHNARTDLPPGATTQKSKTVHFDLGPGTHTVKITANIDHDDNLDNNQVEREIEVVCS